MSYTSPQPRMMPQPHPPPEAEAAPAAHEIRYRHDAAHYVSSMLTELRQIAAKAGFDRLVTAIDAAYYEAYGVLGAQSKSPAVQDGDTPEKISENMEPNGR